MKQKSKFATSADNDAIGYIAAIAKTREAAAQHVQAVKIKAVNAKKHAWRGATAIPPGSALSNVLRSVEKHTDLPLDLPLHSFLFYLATYFMASDIKINCGGQIGITPELWTIVLAPSGCGKTYSLDRIKKSAPVQANIGGIVSGRALFDAFKTNEAEGLPNAFLCDEVGQLVKSMEQDGSPLAAAKLHFLNAYGGGPIEYTTGKEGKMVVQKTTMSFLGLNVDSTFFKILSAESFLDGFCQRFAFVMCERDPSRPFTNYPRYDNAAIEEAAALAWAEILALPLHSSYTYTPAALDAFDTHFKELGENIESSGVVAVSFFRRQMQRSHALALAYHIILGKTTAEIDAVDVAWAMKLTNLSLDDIATAIIEKSGKAADILEALMALGERIEGEGGRLTARDIQRLGPSIFRGNSELAKMALEAYKNMKKGAA